MKEYEKLLIDYAKYLSIMKDEAKEYAETLSGESYYLIINDLPTIERMKQRLLKLLPKTYQKEILSQLAENEFEIYQLLRNTPLAKPFAEAVKLNSHHLSPATAVGFSTGRLWTTILFYES